MPEEQLKSRIDYFRASKKYDDLNSAVSAGDKSAVESFLFAGKEADKSRDGGDFNTPLHVAAYKKDFEMFELLYKSLPRERRLKTINTPNKNGVTPLLEASLMPEFVDDKMLENMPKLMKYIVSHGGDCNAKGFINGQVEYRGKIQYCNALETLNLQLDEYDKNSKEFAVLQKCVSQVNFAMSLEQNRTSIEKE